jgi:hypothetical protein
MAEIRQTDESGERSQLFIEFIMMHAQQAALFLGQYPHPETGERMVNLGAAKLFIDHLAMLRDKTRGNLNSAEESVLNDATASLQMAFVEAVRAGGGGAAGEGIQQGAQGAGSIGQTPEEPGQSGEATAGPGLSAEAAAADDAKKRFTKSYG